MELQRKAAGPGELKMVPPIVHEVLRSPGQPLDPTTRAFFEPRFGHDFSRVRVHADARAAESARVVNALAYTVGRDVVFGAGRYGPQTETGRTLLAHELTHVAQQSAAASDEGQTLRLSDPSSTSEQEADAASQAMTPHTSKIQSSAPTASLRMVQRACITDPECEVAAPGALPGSAVKGSVEHARTEIERGELERAAEEKRKTPREIRRELCGKEPPDPGCTGDGHGRRATASEELFGPLVPKLKLAAGIFVDKDMEKGYEALKWCCGCIGPKIEGDQCIFVREHLENGAALYKKGEKTIAGKDREEWLTEARSTITHEVEHVRFEKEIEKTEPRPEACKFSEQRGGLTELAAIMSEFPVVYRASAGKPWHERRVALDGWFRFKITQPSTHGQSIAGILKAMGCRCECEDVHAYVKRVVEFTTGSWTEAEKNTFHTELRNRKLKPDWPIETPLPPRDIPSYMLTPTGGLGYSYSGSFGVEGSLGLDVGVPLDRLGKWQLLLGAQGRVIWGLGKEPQQAYLLGLKVGFLRGPALGSSGPQVSVFGEVGGGYFTSSPLGGPKTGEGGAYAGGGVALGYSFGITGRSIVFMGAELAAGGRIDTTKPEVEKWLIAGFTIGVQR